MSLKKTVVVDMLDISRYCFPFDYECYYVIPTEQQPKFTEIRESSRGESEYFSQIKNRKGVAEPLAFDEALSVIVRSVWYVLFILRFSYFIDVY